MVAAQAVGSLPAALSWSIEMTTLAHEITGAPLMLLANSIGPIGQFAWMSFADSIDALEDNTQKLWQDERYMAKLGESAGLFSPNSPGSSTWRKVH